MPICDSNGLKTKPSRKRELSTPSRQLARMRYVVFIIFSIIKLENYVIKIFCQKCH